MSAPLLIIGILLLAVGICSFIGALIVSNFSFDSKIVKYNDIHEKFERNYLLEYFIGTYSGASGLIFMFIGLLLVLDCFIPKSAKVYTPTAIDVYRGKTELKITSIGGAPIDTVVVWKDVITE